MKCKFWISKRKIIESFNGLNTIKNIKRLSQKPSKMHEFPTLKYTNEFAKRFLFPIDTYNLSRYWKVNFLHFIYCKMKREPKEIKSSAVSCQASLRILKKRRFHVMGARVWRISLYSGIDSDSMQNKSRFWRSIL